MKHAMAFLLLLPALSVTVPARAAENCAIESVSKTGVPPEAWLYKLGNRCALDWVLDQYKEKKPRDPTIREKFDMSATRYYQTLNALIDSPAALAHDPLLVKRLARMRSSRQKARTAKRLGLG